MRASGTVAEIPWSPFSVRKRDFALNGVPSLLLSSKCAFVTSLAHTAGKEIEDVSRKRSATGDTVDLYVVHRMEEDEATELRHRDELDSFGTSSLGISLKRSKILQGPRTMTTSDSATSMLYLSATVNPPFPKLDAQLTTTFHLKSLRTDTS